MSWQCHRAQKIRRLDESLKWVPSICHVSFKHICAQDKDTGPELAIVTDRAQSRGSLKSRQANIMVHWSTFMEASFLRHEMILGLQFP